MNVKKICSALGVGLAFVAILSLLTSLALASAVEEGSAHPWYGDSGAWGRISAEAYGVWDDNTLILQYGPSYAATGYGGSLTLHQNTKTHHPQIVQACIEATFHYDNVYRTAFAWVSPGAPTVVGGGCL
ncbi:MAG: hypothetical protein LBC12_08140 [Nitrososphaerota archaeon]|jgi:hypothetical protein|nr:hypothetical protein [Nitrososphaerota archaeon]